jgi:hypothetical protein
MELLLKDKNAITGTFVNVTSGTLPSYMTPAFMITQRQVKAA